MFKKLNLLTDDRVRLTKLDSESLDSLSGHEGTIVGVAVRHIVDFYIVLLDKPYIYDGFLHKAVLIPESCLERIG